MNISLRRSLFYSTAIAALTLVGGHGAMAQTTHVLGGGSTLAALDYDNEFSDAGLTGFTYCSIGSGAGTSAFVGDLTAPLTADTTHCPSSIVTGKSVDYGASDAYISSTSITAYNTENTTINAGPLVQLPMLGTPVAIALNTHLGNKTVTADGQVILNDAQLCGILSGSYTSWSQITNSLGSSIPTSGPIKVAYRLDSSGTSFLTTSHLKAVCPVSSASTPSFTSAQLAAMPTNTFATSLFGGSLPALPASFIGGTGSSGVEAAVAGTSNTIGYLSPDYTDISTNGANAGDPFVAAMINGNNHSAYTPTVANTSAAIGTITAPTGAAEASPTNWAPVNVNTALNNPAAGYPIAGYTYWLLPTCYATAAEATKVIDFLEAHLNQSGSETTLVDDIESNGFMPVPGVTDSAAPTSYAAAILSVFVTGDTQHLNIASVGASGGNATRCTSAAGR